MLRRSPLRAKRPTPRRNEGRVTYERTKPKAGEGPTVEQQHYWAWLRAIVGRCENCGTRAALNIHHLLASAAGKIGRRDHWFVVLICRNCHTGTEGVHGLGSEAKFQERHGVDLVAISAARLKEWQDDVAG